MKKLNSIIIAIILAFLSLPAFSAEPDENEIALYTKDEFVSQPLNRMHEILSRFHTEAPDKNILFYMHGRKHHVIDEWKQLKIIEKNFNVKVVMFHWPSWTSLLSRPVEKAKGAADELNMVLHDIQAYKEENPEIFIYKKITFLIHSMGHVVLREYIEKYHDGDLNGPRGERLFNDLISVGADVGLIDHRLWFSKIDFADRKFIMMNNRDIVLRLSYLLDIRNKEPFDYKLGLGFSNFPILPKKFAKYLDPGTTYIDLSWSLKSDHRYFQSNESAMLSIFKPLFNGGLFEPEKLKKTKYVKDNNFYYIIDWPF